MKSEKKKKKHQRLLFFYFKSFEIKVMCEKGEKRNQILSKLKPFHLLSLSLSLTHARARTSTLSRTLSHSLTLSLLSLPRTHSWAHARTLSHSPSPANLGSLVQSKFESARPFINAYSASAPPPYSSFRETHLNSHLASPTPSSHSQLVQLL